MYRRHQENPKNKTRKQNKTKTEEFFKLKRVLASIYIYQILLMDRYIWWTANSYLSGIHLWVQSHVRSSVFVSRPAPLKTSYFTDPL